MDLLSLHSRDQVRFRPCACELCPLARSLYVLMTHHEGRWFRSAAKFHISCAGPKRSSPFLLLSVVSCVLSTIVSPHGAVGHHLVKTLEQRAGAAGKNRLALVR